MIGGMLLDAQPAPHAVTGLLQLIGKTPWLQSVHVEAPALQRIRPGQDALVIVADLNGVIPASVKEVKGNDVTLSFVSPSPVIRPGMTAQVRLKLE